MSDDWGAKDWAVTLVVCVIAGVLILASLSRGLLIDHSGAERAAAAFGISAAVETGSQWVLPGLAGCDGGDALAVNLHGLNTAGTPVDVVACSGFPFKGWTVRVR